jgi:hypothetical protein
VTGSDSQTRVGISAFSDRFDDDDADWLDQQAGIFAELQNLPGVTRETPAPAGAKGTADVVILALGSAGAFTAAVETLRLWLTRDRSRSIEIAYRTADGREQSLVVRSTGLREDTFDDLLKAVRHQLDR